MLRGGSLTLRCPIAGCCASFTRVLGSIDPGTITSFKVGQAPFLKTNWRQCSDHNIGCHDAWYGFVQKWTIWWFPVFPALSQQQTLQLSQFPVWLGSNQLVDEAGGAPVVMEPSTTVEAMSQDTEGIFCPKRLDPHTGSYNYENVPCSF